MRKYNLNEEAEKIVENTKESYYNTLQQSSINWHNNANNYEFFVEYYLGIILSAYKDFSTRVELIIKNHLEKMTNTEIANICPDISQGSVERALRELLKKEKY